MKPLTRRAFVKGLGAVSASAWISARGREAGTASQESVSTITPAAEVNLSSNENPVGPGKHVLDAVRGTLGDEGADAGRYLFGRQAELNERIAAAVGGERENIIVGAGSSEILRLAADVFTAEGRRVITPDPTFGTCAGFAATLGRPVQRIGLDAELRVDLEKTAREVAGAGLVYLCNPNNPTATIWPAAELRAAIELMLRRSPETHFLIDEAYHDYVTSPEHESLAPFALSNPRVLVARTFSKAFGLAGLRIGYGIGHEDTVRTLTEWRGMDMFTSVPGRAGAEAALAAPRHVAAEVGRNRALRERTRAFFHDLGLEDTDSQANFVYIDIRRSNEDFKKACRERGVLIGSGSKLYPTYARVTIGTAEEMERAFEVFTDLLKRV